MASRDRNKVLSIVLQIRDRMRGPLKVARVALKAFQKIGVGSLRAVAGAASFLGRTIRAIVNPMNLLRASLIALPFAAVLKQASSSQATMSALAATFEDNADAAREWGIEFAESVGRSRAEVAGSQRTFGAFFRGLGFGNDEALQLSNTLTALSVDFASFNDLADSEGIERFISALSGSSEVLDRFGVNIKAAALDQKLLQFGFEGGTARATEQQKAIARLAIIYEAMGQQGALGDAIRTQEEFSNSLKIARAAVADISVSLGEPFLKPLGAGLRIFAEFLRDNEQAVQQWAEGVVFNLGVVGIRSKAFFDLIRDLRRSDSTLDDLDRILAITGDLALGTFKDTLVGGLRVTGNVLELFSKPLLIAASRLGVELGRKIREGLLDFAFESDAEELLRLEDELAGIQDRIVSRMGLVFDENTGNVVATRAFDETDELLQRQAERLVGRIDELQERMALGSAAIARNLREGFEEAADEARQQFGDISEAIGDTVDSIQQRTGDALSAMRDLGGSFEHPSARAKILTGVVDEGSEAIGRFLQSWEGAPDLMERWTNETNQATDAGDRYKGILEDLNEMFQSLDTTQKQNEQSASKLIDRYDDLADTLFKVGVAGRRARAELAGGVEGEVLGLGIDLDQQLRNIDRFTGDAQQMLADLFKAGGIPFEIYGAHTLAIEKSRLDQRAAAFAAHNRRLLEISGTFAEGFADFFTRGEDKMVSAFERGRQFAETAVQTFSRGVGNIFRSIQDGSDATKEAVKRLTAEVLNLVGQLAAQRFLGALFPGIGGGFSLPSFGGLFAKGGTAMNAVPVKAFAGGGMTDGGVMRRPTMFALGGEGNRREAFVPLPDNRAIPAVVTEPDGGPREQINVTVNINAIDTASGKEFIASEKEMIVDIMQEAWTRRTDVRRNLKAAAR